MQVQVDIGFDQLIKIVRELPKARLMRLQMEIEQAGNYKSDIDLEVLLLNGPTATEEQLATIANNRIAINKWRSKK